MSRLIKRGQPMSIGHGFTANHVNSDMFDRQTGPVIMIDDFKMSAPTFPPHPHAGISAVTYVLPESTGAHHSYDSMGGDIPIQPGDLHWFGAANSAIHTEEPDDAEVHALQLFINLPIKDKRKKPFSKHLYSGDIPEIVTENSTFRVVIGELNGHKSPFEPPIPMELLDCRAKAGNKSSFPTTQGWGGMIYCLKGKIEIIIEDDPSNKYILEGKDAIGFESEQSFAAIVAAEDSHWIILMGEALHEPYALGGPIIMESQEANLERMTAYRQGQMGSLPPPPQ